MNNQQHDVILKLSAFDVGTLKFAVRTMITKERRNLKNAAFKGKPEGLQDKIADRIESYEHIMTELDSNGV